MSSECKQQKLGEASQTKRNKRKDSKFAHRFTYYLFYSKSISGAKAFGNFYAWQRLVMTISGGCGDKVGLVKQREIKRKTEI